jgi:hypothetical protein
VEEKAPDRGEGRSEEVMATMDLELGLPVVHDEARGGSAARRGREAERQRRETRGERERLGCRRTSISQECSMVG